MPFSIVVAGPGKTDTAFRPLVDRYLKKAAAFTPVTLVETKAYDHDGGLPADEVLRREAADLDRRLGRERVRIALTLDGDALDSPALARYIGTLREGSAAGAAFIVGSPDGLDSAFAAACRRRIRLGDITLPHDLARIVVLEQVYRALTILHRVPYHR